jgi:hypothetical protein
MPWVKLDDQFPDHRKLAELGDYAPACGWLYVCGLAYCNRQLTDGRIPKAHVHRLASFRHLSIGTGRVGSNEAPLAPMPEAIDADELAEMLVDAGLWEDDGDFFLVHDYGEYQFTKVEVEAMREQRRQAGRIGGKARHKRDAKHVASEMPGENPGKMAAKLNPVPDPVPQRTHTPYSDHAERNEPDGPVKTAKPLTKPLGYKPRIDVAWPGRPPVPSGLHAEFVDRLSGDSETARAKLMAWYPEAASAWADKPIGDDDWKFWRLRFREWVGTTATPAGSRPKTDAELKAEEDAAFEDINKWRKLAGKKAI